MDPGEKADVWYDLAYMFFMQSYGAQEIHVLCRPLCFLKHAARVVIGVSIGVDPITVFKWR